jgi:hypothetical protein
VTVPFTKVVLVRVWTGIELVPEAVSPVVPVVAVAVQLKVEPATLADKVTATEVPPEQIDWVKGVLVTAGRGFTVMV